MAQTKAGAVKRGAKKIGCSPTAWHNYRSRGLKWCYVCKRWLRIESFGRDRTKYDGLTGACQECKNTDERLGYLLRGRRKTEVP